MALKKSSNAGWHFWVRLIGLTGLALLVVGVVLRSIGMDEWSVFADWPIFTGDWQAFFDEWKAFAQWTVPATWTVPVALTFVGGILALAGAVLAGIALLFELRGAFGMAFRRTALGSNVALQVGLAVALLVGVNVFSFFHHVRFDLTDDHVFTIDSKIRDQLAQLRGETTIIVYQLHTSFGQLGDKQDNYDAAAERVIVAKVRDLVEQFQELGPRFHVEVFDIQDEGFEDRMAALKKKTPELAEALAKAPENSIFFYAGDKVQRLSFHDIFQLDKVASQEANGSRGNLVLRDQGVEPFAQKVLNIDEKKPRVAIGVIHEVLGLEFSDEGSKEISMSGLKKVLAARGFEGSDLILKQWRRGAMPSPAVFTHDESKFERFEVRMTQLDSAVRQLSETVKEYEGQLRDWEGQSAEMLKKKYAIAVTALGSPRVLELREIEEFEKRTGRKPRTVPITDETRVDYIEYVKKLLPELQKDLKTEEDERTTLSRKQSELSVENLAEQRRITDLRAKMDRMLANVDLLIVPRLTLLDVANGQNIRSWLHNLDNEQVAAIKEYMKSGKPVLFLLGPPISKTGDRPPPGMGGQDRLEELATDLGIKLPAQTVLFNVENEALAEQQAGFIIPSPPSEVPPVALAWKSEDQPRFPGVVVQNEGPSNPVHISLSLAANSVGKSGALDLRLRNPRPVYYDPSGKDNADPRAVFLMTSKDCWNESQPFASDDYTPQFNRSKADDPTRGTLLEERAGPFPIAVAVETKLPASWYGEKEGKPATARVAVIGHGGVFSGPALSPAKEKVFLDASNWLLHRDDLLASQKKTWQYPRVELSSSEKALWGWGTILGMPLLCVYTGLVVLMVRRMR